MTPPGRAWSVQPRAPGLKADYAINSFDVCWRLISVSTLPFALAGLVMRIVGLSRGGMSGPRNLDISKISEIAKNAPTENAAFSENSRNSIIFGRPAPCAAGD